jgi:ApbE superfamily uncharacterized protein (UPF0280 family)
MTATTNRYREFVWKDAAFLVETGHWEALTGSIVSERAALEAYIEADPGFAGALAPVPVRADAPEAVRRMHRASLLTGVGPMAAVAGTMAQLAVEAAQRAGDRDTVVNNGGDIFAATHRTLTVGLHPGTDAALPEGLAFVIEPEAQPLALCSSSGRMGHSLSLGRCDLATVLAGDAALADAAATLAANLVHGENDIEPALERVAAIPGILGLVIACNGRIGLRGRLPRLVRTSCPGLVAARVTRHPEAKTACHGAAT